MKSFFLLLLACVLLTFSATAQTAVAKIKYEEAEEAFTQGQYATTLTRLDEAEKILGASNPRILYLRIMAADKVVQADPYTNFALLQRLRQQCALYLTKYDNLENNEDKYRDVYKVSESLKQLPASQAAVDAHARSMQAKQEEKESARRNEATQLIRSRAYVDDLVDKFKFKAGLTIEEFRVYNPAASGLTSEANNSYYSKSTLKQEMKKLPVIGPLTAFLDSNGKVGTYLFCLSSELTDEARNQLFDKLVNEIRSNVSAAYITVKEEKSIAIKVPGSKAQIGFVKFQQYDSGPKSIYLYLSAPE